MSQSHPLKWIAVGALIPILAMACALAGVVYAQGSLDPSAAPAPTMKTLDEIYSRAGDAVRAAEGMSEVNGIGWSRGRTDSGSLGTVPEGHELVILMIASTSTTSFQIQAGATTLFAGYTTYNDGTLALRVPNGCMVAGPGEDINVTLVPAVPANVGVSVIGYLRSISK